MKRFPAIVILALNYLVLSGTHNRAGEITYVQLSDLTYNFTITTFTYTLSLADRPSLEVNWGDNSISTAQRVEKTKLPNFYQKNVYLVDHTFPGPGVYKVVVQDPNRNLGVLNIPNSVNVVFSITTIVTVNPAMGYNSTPVLLNPPYDKAALGYVFIHNPAAYDPDGDSLSYQLTVCTRENGKPIENYTLPPATNYLIVDPVTGDLIWDTPADTGTYNVAMEIQEWRNGKKIGVVVRDMQIEVFKTNNKPPEIGGLHNLCREVGDTISFTVSATDPNNDMISLKATSGIFSLENCIAGFTGTDSVPGRSSSGFRWIPCHEAVRGQPYIIIFKADDNNEELMLSDIDNITIKILGPPPELTNAVPEGKFIRLTWMPYGTAAIAGFNIYRREGPTEFTPDSCTAGVPAATGFVRVGYIAGSNTVEYIDTDNGQGLQFGTEYSYRIVAVYKNGTESKSSNEITSLLVSGVPVITKVSVSKTDPAQGIIDIAWKKPDRLDTIPNVNGPYEYYIYRAKGIGSNDYVLIDSILTTDLNDTTYVDTPDTESSGYVYRIELHNRTPGYEFMIGEPGIASSLFISVSPGDRKARFILKRNVPWINTEYDFFRLNKTTSVFDSIGTTNQLSFIDYGLINEEEYCYYVRSTGGYLADDMPKGLINFSQVACVTPRDNEPPCPPEIDVTSECDSLYNKVTWSISDPECFDDVAGYKIYYKMKYEDQLALIETIDNKYVMQYKHYPGDIVAGCYAVSAYDLMGNESLKSVIVCVDSCQFYEIPNVFTPNNDGINDRLIAKTSGLVEKVDFKLYNRNGLLVFSTQEPRLNWDGTYKGKIVSPGVYFYHCDVFENRITGLEQFHLSGFVYVITEEGARAPKQETK